MKRVLKKKVISTVIVSFILFIVSPLLAENRPEDNPRPEKKHSKTILSFNYGVGLSIKPGYYLADIEEDSGYQSDLLSPVNFGATLFFQFNQYMYWGICGAHNTIYSGSMIDLRVVDAKIMLRLMTDFERRNFFIDFGVGVGYSIYSVKEPGSLIGYTYTRPIIMLTAIVRVGLNFYFGEAFSLDLGVEVPWGWDVAEFFLDDRYDPYSYGNLGVFAALNFRLK